MGLRKRNGVFCINETVRRQDGVSVRVRESLNTSNERTANKLYADFLRAIDDGSFWEGRKIIPIIREVISRYMAEVAIMHKSKQRSGAIAQYWYDFFGDIPVSEVTSSLLSSYKAERLVGKIMHGKGKGRKAGPSTVKKELGFLRQVLNYAMAEWDEDWDGYFKKYPADPVKKVMRGLKDVERCRLISHAEAATLSGTLPIWLAPIVIVGCQTGLRESNIAYLEQSEVDFLRGIILIPAEKTKNGKPMIIKMTTLVQQTLLDALRHRKSASAYFFTDADGNAYDPKRISMAFMRATRRANLRDLRFHDLRHDFASVLANEGATLYQIQQLLGHSDPRMTQRYTHLLPENLNVANFLEGKGTAAVLAQNWHSEEKKEGLITTTP